MSLKSSALFLVLSFPSLVIASPSKLKSMTDPRDAQFSYLLPTQTEGRYILCPENWELDPISVMLEPLGGRKEAQAAKTHRLSFKLVPVLNVAHTAAQQLNLSAPEILWEQMEFSKLELLFSEVLPNISGQDARLSEDGHIELMVDLSDSQLERFHRRVTEARPLEGQLKFSLKIDGRSYPISYRIAIPF